MKAHGKILDQAISCVFEEMNRGLGGRVGSVGWRGLRQEGMRRRDGRREWLVVRGEGCVVVWA